MPYIREINDRWTFRKVDTKEYTHGYPFANWIMKVEMSDPSELEALMDAAAYEEMCANE